MQAHQILQVCIVEDAPDAARALARKVKSTPGLLLTGIFSEAAGALAFIRNNPPHLLLLDIGLPGQSGMQLAEIVHKSPLHTQIIFITAYQEFALEAFKVRALDYLLKPITHRTFEKLMLRVRDHFSQPLLQGAAAQQSAILVKTQQGILQRIAVEEIVYVESNKPFFYIQTLNLRHTVLPSLKELESRLRGHAFVRVHRSFLVAQAFIDQVADEQLLLKNGMKLPLGRSYKDEVMAAFC